MFRHTSIFAEELLDRFVPYIYIERERDIEREMYVNIIILAYYILVYHIMLYYVVLVYITLHYSMLYHSISYYLKLC